MEGSFFDLMDDLGLRLQLHDAYTNRDDKRAREIEQLLRERESGRSSGEPAERRIPLVSRPVPFKGFGSSAAPDASPLSNTPSV